MNLTQKDLSELKDIYFRLYKKVLNDDEALDLANRLVNLFKVVSKPIQDIDSIKKKMKNGTKDG